MKIRTGFVSNSSTTSYVVLGYNNAEYSMEKLIEKFNLDLTMEYVNSEEFDVWELDDKLSNIGICINHNIVGFNLEGLRESDLKDIINNKLTDLKECLTNVRPDAEAVVHMWETHS